MTDRTTQGDAKRLLAELRSDLYEAAPAPLAHGADRELREIEEIREMLESRLQIQHSHIVDEHIAILLNHFYRLTAANTELQAEVERLNTSLHHAQSDLGNAREDIEAVWDTLTPHIANGHDAQDFEIVPALAQHIAAELAEAKAELERAQRLVHPWYGPCDALEIDGRCAECDFVARLKWPEHIVPLKAALSPTATREEPTGSTTYRGLEITYRGYKIRPPIPDVSTWYEWEIDGYDGAPDSPTRNHWGRAKSIEACREAIDDLLEGQSDE